MDSHLEFGKEFQKYEKKLKIRENGFSMEICGEEFEKLKNIWESMKKKHLKIWKNVKKKQGKMDFQLEFEKHEEKKSGICDVGIVVKSVPGCWEKTMRYEGNK